MRDLSCRSCSCFCWMNHRDRTNRGTASMSWICWVGCVRGRGTRGRSGMLVSSRLGIRGRRRRCGLRRGGNRRCLCDRGIHLGGRWICDGGTGSGSGSVNGCESGRRRSRSPWWVEGELRCVRCREGCFKVRIRYAPRAEMTWATLRAKPH